MNQNTKLNGLILPAPLLDEINEASNYFGSCFESMIFNSIEKNLLDKDQKVITALNESFQKMTYIKNTLKNNEKFNQIFHLEILSKYLFRSRFLKQFYLY